MPDDCKTRRALVNSKALVLIVPGRLETRSGGYEYDRRIVTGLRGRGWSVEVQEVGESFPQPTPAALDHAARVLAAIPDGTTVVIDGLALGALPVEAEREALRLRLVALVHLPLADEIGVDRDTAVRLEASERRALAAVALVVVTGKAMTEALLRYGVWRNRIAVVEPGTDRAPVARGSGGPSLQLLSAAALTPRKGHEILIRALAMIPHRSWHLTCAGSLDRDPPTVDRVRARVHGEGLEDRVSLIGELDGEALGGYYDRADVFVLATLHESYCMAVAEALAHGLPVVSTTTGAIPELVGAGRNWETPAGLLVPPGDVDALTAALSKLVGEAGLRDQLAEGARRVRDRLPTWDDAVDKMAAALAVLNDVG
ncbi:MAG: glycosyltransferase [Acidobacteria bacterium]|nr:glycosyltransferase [Acidobacteriota bacterium]